MTLAALILGQVAGLALTGVGMRMTVDAAVRGARLPLLLAVVTAMGGVGLSWGGSNLVQMLRTDLSDRIGYLQLEPEVQRLVAELDGLEHLERSDYLDRLALLTGRSQLLADAAWGLVELGAFAAQLMVMLILLATVDPLLLCLGLAALPGVLLGGRAQRYVRNAMMASSSSSRLERQLHEIITRPAAGKEIRVCDASGTLIGLADDAWAQATRTQAGGHRRAVLLAGASTSIFVLGYAATLAYLVQLVSRGEHGVGDLILVLTLAGQVRATFGMAIRKRAEVQLGLSLAEPLNWLRRYTREHRPPDGAGRPAPAELTDGITLRQVTFEYAATGRRALGPVSVRLPAGTVVALVGEHGAGKSTLVKLLGKFYQPSDGTIEVDGAPLASIDTASWRAASTAAFQDFARYESTLRLGVAFADISGLHEDDRLRTALTDGGAEELPDQLPHGLDTRLGPDVDLSEGQWQKIALARACLRHAPVLAVLDEPTASLDARSEHETFLRYSRLARRLAAQRGTITVIVSHRFSTVRMADLILVLDQGLIVEQGTHDQLMTLGGRYAKLYLMQANAYQTGSAVTA